MPSKKIERKKLLEKEITRNKENKNEKSEVRRKSVTQITNRRTLLTDRLDKIDRDLQVLYAVATREQRTVVDSLYENNPSNFTAEQFSKRQINLYEQTRKISRLEMERRKVLDDLLNISL